MRYLLLLFSLLICQGVQAQFPIDLEIDQATTKQADKLTQAYDDELAFTPKQFLLVKNILEKTIAKQAYASDRLEGREKLDIFYAVRKQQDQEMGEVLTRIQFRRYRQLQPEIQPLARVQSESEQKDQ